MANLTMTNWHIQDKTPYIKLGSSGENNASSINITVDELVEGATYYLDIGDANDSGLPNTQEMTPYAYTNAENENIYVLQMKPLRSWLGHDGIKLLQVRCVYTDNDEEVCKQSNVIHGIVTKNTGFVYQYSIAIFEQYIQKIKELVANLPITLSKLKDVAIDTPTDGQVLKYDGTAQKWVNGEGGGGGTTNYNTLNNLPSINGVTLKGNKTTSDIGIVVPTKTSDLTNDSGFITANDVKKSVYVDTIPMETIEDAIYTKETIGNPIIKNSIYASTEDTSVAFGGIFKLYCDITEMESSVSGFEDYLYTPKPNYDIKIKLPNSNNYVHFVSIKLRHERLSWTVDTYYDTTYYTDNPSTTYLDSRRLTMQQILYDEAVFTPLQVMMIGNETNQNFNTYELTNKSTMDMLKSLIWKEQTINDDNVTTSFELSPNVSYVFNNRTSNLDFTFSNFDTSYKQCKLIIHTGATAPTITFPNDYGVNIESIDPDSTYELICTQLGCYGNKWE